MEKLHVHTTVTIPEPSTEVALPLISSPLLPPMSPPPPYGSPSSPSDMFEYFAASDAAGDKIAPVISRKPVPTSSGVDEKSVLPAPPEQRTTRRTIKRKPVATVSEVDGIERRAVC